MTTTAAAKKNPRQNTHTQNKPKQTKRKRQTQSKKKDSGKQTPGKKCCASMVRRNGTRKATKETDAILEKL
jgi:hypothetical protein